MSRFRVAAVLGVLAVVLAVPVATAAPATETPTDVTADPTTAGERSTHTVTVTAHSFLEFDAVAVDYGETGVYLGDVDPADVTTFGIDRAGDDDGAAVDESINGSLAALRGTDAGLRADLNGSVELSPDDQVVLVYENTVNPEVPGNYTVGVDLAPDRSGGDVEAALLVEPKEPNFVRMSADDDESTVDVRYALQTGTAEFIVVYNQSGHVIGVSDYLGDAEEFDRRWTSIQLDGSEYERQTVRAVMFNDTDRNRAFNRSSDRPYTVAGNPVELTATLFGEATATATTDAGTTTAAPGTTADPTGNETTGTPVATTTGTSPATNATTADGQPGFGPAAGVLALGVAALAVLVAGRRRT